MRYMVEQGQTTESRQKTVLSGFSFARRLTRLISVPTAQTVPGSALVTVLMMNSVEPFESAASHRLHEAFGVDDYVDVRVLRAGLLDLRYGEARVHRAVALPEDDLALAKRVCRVAAQRLERVPDDHLVEPDPELEGGVASQVLIGQEEHALAALEGPPEGRGRVRRCADDAAVPCRRAPLWPRSSSCT